MGSSSNLGGGGLTGIGGIANECGGTFEFLVVLLNDKEPILFNLKVGEEIKLKLIEGNLPRLEVVTIKDESFIGLVPPSLSWLIRCINNGWKYYGNIIRIEDAKIEPKVYIRIKGEC